MKINGIMIIERTAYNDDEASVKRYNEKYGERGWRYSDIHVCSYLTPECGGTPNKPAKCATCKYREA